MRQHAARTDGSNQTRESFSGVINSTGAALDVRPLTVTVTQAQNLKQAKVELGEKQTYITKHIRTEHVCAARTRQRLVLWDGYIKVKTSCLTQKLTH